jgi:hypothetical protein
MIDEVTKAIESYKEKWQTLLDGRTDTAFFKELRPTAVAYKVTDRAEFGQRCLELRDYCDQIHLGWVNERWLGTFHLKDTTLPWEIRVIKIMERRPNSTDPVGLDHIDFLVSPGSDTKGVLDKESLKWTEETNGAHCKWLSVWFAGTEAKLRTDTVLQVCADEMLASQEALLQEH